MDRRLVLDHAIHMCETELRLLNSDSSGPLGKDLIITSGDVTDVDGFFALAKYAISGADVIFVMNYPAYLKHADSDVVECNAGLGFRYNVRTFSRFFYDTINGEVKRLDLHASRALYSRYEYYTRTLRNYGYTGASLTSDILSFKKAMTDLAFCMAKLVWDEARSGSKHSGLSGGLFFCVGGVNEINPFHASRHKNELFLYWSALRGKVSLRVNTVHEGTVFDSEGRVFSGGVKAIYGKASRVFIDFNGSMAFWNDSWMGMVLSQPYKISGAFVMGGVYSDTKPSTVPLIPGILNRFSSATMNQLYHPLRTVLFFSCMAWLGVDIYTVTSNDIPFIVDEGQSMNFSSEANWLRRFMKNNSIESASLYDMAKAYYGSGGRAKAFDLYTAIVLLRAMESTVPVVFDARMFVSPEFGTTLVSKLDCWEDAAAEFDEQIVGGDRVKYANELAILPQMKTVAFDVKTTLFNVSDYTISPRVLPL